MKLRLKHQPNHAPFDPAEKPFTVSSMTTENSRLIGRIEAIASHRVFGRVTGVQGLLVEVAGIEHHLSVGDRCNVLARGDRRVVPRQSGGRLVPVGAGVHHR